MGPRHASPPYGRRRSGQGRAHRRARRWRSARYGAAAALLLGASAALAARPSPPEDRAQDDPTARLGCGGCHTGVPDGGIRERTPALGPDGIGREPEALFTDLGEPPPPPRPDGARMPDFDLSEGERVALTLFLAGEPSGAGAFAGARSRHEGLTADDGERIFRALDCAGCHSHPDVAPRRSAPDLAGVGDRIRPAWLRTWLARPVPIRPTGAPSGTWSRMPDYGLDEEEVAALAERLGESSAPPPPTDPLPAHRARAVEARLDDRLSCLGCHRLDGRGGALGPPLDGVGRRLTPSYLRRVLAEPATALPGGGMPPEPLVIVGAERLARYLESRPGPWAPAERRPLTDPAVAGAMAAAGWDGSGGTASGPAGTAGAAAPTADRDAPDGAALYGRWCAGCHGPAGRGDGWNAPTLPVAPTPHADAGLMSRRPDDTLFDGIHGGAWVLDGSPAMPPFGGMLSAAEIRALVAHIRTLCDCQGPGWSTDGLRRGPG